MTLPESFTDRREETSVQPATEAEIRSAAEESQM
jgi:hypothetical protein